ncbi:hypothetical protein Hanom_Chr14g01318851 [Helianthus anomalus]
MRTKKIPRGADEKFQGVRTKNFKGCGHDFRRNLTLNFFSRGCARPSWTTLKSAPV